MCIVPLLPEFQTLYPDLSADLVLTDAVVDLFIERIDLAIRLGPLADSTLIAQQLMRTHYVVCASPAYLRRSTPLNHPTDVAQHNCLLFPLAGFRSRWIFKAGKQTEVFVTGQTMISSAIALS